METKLEKQMLEFLYFFYNLRSDYQVFLAYNRYRELKKEYISLSLHLIKFDDWNDNNESLLKNFFFIEFLYFDFFQYIKERIDFKVKWKTWKFKNQEYSETKEILKLNNSIFKMIETKIFNENDFNKLLGAK